MLECIRFICRALVKLSIRCRCDNKWLRACSAWTDGAKVVTVNGRVCRALSDEELAEADDPETRWDLYRVREGEFWSLDLGEQPGGTRMIDSRELPEKHFFESTCGTIALSTFRDEWDENTTFVVLTIYGEHCTSWLDRLFHIWSIIRDGHPWGAREVWLREDEADQLGKILQA